MKPLHISGLVFLGDSATGKDLRKLPSPSSLISSFQGKEDVKWAVISVGGGKQRAPPASVSYLHLGILDTSSSSSDAIMLRTITDAVTFGTEQLATGRALLIHCRGGIRRSPTVAAAVVAAAEGMSVDEAMALVKRARPAANPRSEFVAALRTWEVLRDSDAGQGNVGTGNPCQRRHFY